MEENTAVATDTAVETATDAVENPFDVLADIKEPEGPTDVDAEMPRESVEEVVAPIADIDEVEMSDETRAKWEREKKKHKRQVKREAQLKLRRHFEESELMPEPEIEPEPEREPDAEQDSEPESDDKVSAFARTTLHDDQLLKAKAEIDAFSQPDEDYSPIASSSDEDDNERIRSVMASFKADFLENFYFPSLSDISTEPSEEFLFHRLTVQKSQDPTMDLDIGHFVDPLTGELLVSDKVSEEANPEDEAAAEDEEDEDETEESSSTMSFDWPFPLVDPPPPVVQEVDDNEYAMEMMIEAHSVLGVIQVESTTHVEVQRTERNVRQIVLEFVNKTIDDAVNASEYVNPETIKRAKLDKSKLLVALHNLLVACTCARTYNVELNKKMFEYYRRVGQLRSFEPLPPQVEKAEMRRHREALYLLDHLKAKANETKRVNNLLMASVNMDLAYVTTIAMSTYDSLEHCIRHTLVRKDSDYLSRVVENDLRRMQIMRNEISDSRLWLITRHHTLGRLIERKRKFDQITPELTMDQFLNAQRDVTALGTKVEERNHDLTRMRDRCTRHVHQLAFIREKTSMNSALLQTHKSALRVKIRRLNELRDEVFLLKLKHAEIKDQQYELQKKSGLTFKPALLYDYDETVEYIERKNESVKNLRLIVLDLETRIAQIEHHDRCSFIAPPKRTTTTA